MEEQMNYILMPSLKRRALIKTAITLWNQDDVRAFTADIDFESVIYRGREKEWQVVADKVIEKVQVLPIPDSLKNELSAFIKPICMEVLYWWDYNDDFFLFGKRFFKESLNKICWTPQGTVDKKKTAEAIIRDDNLDIKKRYEIACIYCLKNDILMLWNKMPEGYIKDFYSEEDPADVIQHPLVVFWTYDVKGEMTRLENFFRIKLRCTPYQKALERAVIDGNQVATEYFLQKLTSEEREECLVRFARSFCSCSYFFYNVDVLCFLLLQMNEKQQIEMLKDNNYEVLSCLLSWPWQDFFMKMAKQVWAFLPTDNFCHLLKLIIKKIKDGFKDYDYQYLFKEFWQQSPRAHKEHIIDICTNLGDFSLLHLLQIKDKGNIKLILEHLPTPVRERVIFSTCEMVFFYDEIDSLEFFVQECLTTKDITIKFREELEKYMICFRSKETLEKEKDMWNKVFQLLDDLTQKCDNKRCMEDGNNDTAKRFCSLTSEYLSTCKEITDK